MKEKPISVSGKKEKQTLRRCIVTRESASPESLIRFVISPDHVLTPDLGRKLPGKGLWLKPEKDVLHKAIKRDAFSKAAHTKVIVPDNLAELLEKGLLARIIDLLGLARRAGCAIYGFTKVRDWVVKGQAGLIIQAYDGSAEERARLLSGATDIPAAVLLQAAEIGKIFGRDHVVHTAIAKGSFSQRLVSEAGRYQSLTSQSD